MSVLYWGISTETGTNKFFSATEGRFKNISYEYEAGNLSDGLMLKRASWILPNGTSVSAKRLNLHAKARCLTTKSLCLEKAAIESLEIKLVEPKTSSERVKLKNINLLLSVVADDLVVDKLTITHPTKDPIALKNVRLAGEINNSDLHLKKIRLGWNKLDIKARGTLSLQDNYPIDIEGTTTQIAEVKTKHSFSSQWHATGDLETVQLAASINEPIKANVRGTVSLIDKRLPADLTITSDRIALPIVSSEDTTNAPAAVLSESNIRLTGTWPNYATKAEATINSDQFTPMQLFLEGTASVGELMAEPLTIKTQAGQITVVGKVEWLHGLRWQSSVKSDSFNPNQIAIGLAKTNLQSLKGQVEFSGTSYNESTELRLNDIDAVGHFFGQPFNATGNIYRSPTQKWHFNNLQFVSNENHLSANGVLGDKIQLLFSIKTIENFLADAQGDINGNVILTGDIKTPDIDGSVTAASLKIKNFTTRNARIQGFAPQFGHQTSEMKFSADSATVNGQVFNNPLASITGSRSSHILQLQARHKMAGKIFAQANGELDTKLNWTGKVQRAHSRLTKQPVELVNAFEAQWDAASRTLAMQPHCWSSHTTRVCLNEPAHLGQSGSIDFGLRNFPAGTLNTMLPKTMTIGGTLQSNGLIIWGKDTQPTINAIVTANNSSTIIRPPGVEQNISMDFQRASLEVKTIGKEITGAVHLESDKFEKLHGKISVRPGSNSNSIKGNLNLVNADATWLQNYIKHVDHTAGLINARATLGGNTRNPTVDGTATINDAQIQTPLLPVDFKALALTVDFDQRSFGLQGRGKANDSEIKISGNGNHSEAGLFSEINLSSNNIGLEHELAKNALVSPDLKFKISPTLLSITGVVDVPSAQFEIDTFSTNSMTYSNDIVIVEDESTPTKKKTGTKGVITNLLVKLGKNVTVNGFGLAAKLTGDFQFALKPDKPANLSGAISVSDGIYRAYGQKLKIRRGQLSFTGPLEQTTMRVEAIREVKDLIAGVRINGTIQNPTTQLFSEPPSREDEVLPYLVLGRSFDADQGDADIMQRAALFLGVSGGRAVSTGLAQTLGIDDLLLRYGVGVFKNSNSLYLRYDLAEQLYLETTRGIESAVDVFYSLDF